MPSPRTETSSARLLTICQLLLIVELLVAALLIDVFWYTFDLAPTLAIPTTTLLAIVPLLWYLFTGKSDEEAKGYLRKLLVEQLLQRPQRLAILDGVLFVGILLISAALLLSTSVKFFPSVPD